MFLPGLLTRGAGVGPAVAVGADRGIGASNTLIACIHRAGVSDPGYSDQRRTPDCYFIRIGALSSG